MTDKIEEMKEIFNQRRQEYKNLWDKKADYNKRIVVI